MNKMNSKKTFFLLLSLLSWVCKRRYIQIITEGLNFSPLSMRVPCRMIITRVCCKTLKHLTVKYVVAKVVAMLSQVVAGAAAV